MENLPRRIAERRGDSETQDDFNKKSVPWEHYRESDQALRRKETASPSRATTTSLSRAATKATAKSVPKTTTTKTTE